MPLFLPYEIETPNMHSYFNFFLTNNHHYQYVQPSLEPPKVSEVIQIQ